eukprot:CAMPEP_0180793828 /NCGR_PEP_ID=MMETSP1038_2-20121128/55246_1 /TAXON_ID=632150 /ORGANISM="Azadinium spinosum, Strain 3D9" /LENGTH=91 /DNA_ID=CAMNT_0022832451 /DNA_START=25 /DNA_END=297 /DNA_ORIENTATION=+
MGASASSAEGGDGEEVRPRPEPCMVTACWFARKGNGCRGPPLPSQYLSGLRTYRSEIDAPGASSFQRSRSSRPHHLKRVQFPSRQSALATR